MWDGELAETRGTTRRRCIASELRLCARTCLGSFISHGLCFLLLLLFTLSTGQASAQSASTGQLVQTVPFQPIPLPPILQPLPEQPPPPTRPPSLEIPEIPAQPPVQREEITGARLLVKEIRFIGNTAIKTEELTAIAAAYTNREVTNEELEDLRLAVTYAYVNHGYITSGAVFPDQTVADGIVTIQIIEGKLSEINIEGNEWFRGSYFQKRLELSAGPPLNVIALQERLQLLQTDPRIQRLNAELHPGLVRGESALDLRVKETSPFKAWLEFNNFLSPSVGAEQGAITLMDRNLLGFGDTLSVQYGASAGVNPILAFLYAIPVTARDTTISLQYRRFDFKIIESPFDVLNIRNRSQILGVSIRQPLYRTPSQEFALTLALDYEENKSFLMGTPFEFVPGATNGVFRMSVLRFMQDWVHRSHNQVLSALSRFSVGIGVLGATTTSNPDLADARFFAWLGQTQWLRQLTTLRTQLIARAVVQLSNDHLFPLEQIAIGGRYSVRGYRAFTLIRDNAALATVEARIPVYTTAAGIDTVFVAPFIDYGHGWQTNVPTPTVPPQTLASVGVGAIWDFWRDSHFEIYWGQQLNHFSTGRGNLQDHGIYFQLIVGIL